MRTKIATDLDMKGSWKVHRELVYSVAPEAAEAWATVKQADTLRRIQPRRKDAVERVGSAKEGSIAGVGRGGQRSNARSGDSKPRDSSWSYGKEVHSMVDCTTKRKSGLPGG